MNLKRFQSSSASPNVTTVVTTNVSTNLMMSTWGTFSLCLPNTEVSSVRSSDSGSSGDEGVDNFRGCRLKEQNRKTPMVSKKHEIFSGLKIIVFYVANHLL